MHEKYETCIAAGRCISGTHEANFSYRTMPISMATGQAAGVCAAMAVRRGMHPRDVAVGEVEEGDLGRGWRKIRRTRCPEDPLGPRFGAQRNGLAEQNVVHCRSDVLMDCVHRTHGRIER